MRLTGAPTAIISDACNEGEWKDQLGGAVLRDLTVSSCRATNVGGGIAFECPTEGYSVRNCEIIGCHSSGGSDGGGGVWMKLNTAFNHPAILFEYCFFNNNVASATDQGHDLYYCEYSGGYFTADADQGPLNKETCSTRTPETHPTHYCSCDGSVADGWLLAGDRIREPQDIFVHPASTNTDTRNCGFRPDSIGSCNSIEIALKTDSVSKGQSIILLGGVHSKEQSQLTIADNYSKRLVIQGQTENENTSIAINIPTSFAPLSWIKLESSNTAGISIQNVNISVTAPESPSKSRGNEATAATFNSLLFEIAGNLELTSVTLSSDPTITCAQSIISLTSGSASFSATNFENFTFSGSPLISCIGGVIASQEPTTFLSIVRQSGSGSSFEVAGDGSQAVAISNATFNNCTSNDGDGGAVYITLGANSKLTIGAALANDTFFKNCQAKSLTSGHSNEDSTTGHGGAICLQALDGFTVSSTSESLNPLLQNIRFGTHSEKNDAPIGPDLFVSGSVEVLVNEEHFPVLNQWVGTCSNGSEELIEGWETQAIGIDKETAALVPLLLYRFKKLGTVRVRSIESKDVPLCGLAALPCASVLYGWQQQEYGEKNMIILDSTPYHAFESLGDYSLSVKGEEKVCNGSFPSLSLFHSLSLSLFLWFSSV